MSAEVITALIAALGGVSIAGASYWFTKQREREAELRREKLNHYKEFTDSLSSIISGESTDDSQRAFAHACNKLNLIAPQPVLEALRAFQQEIKIGNPERSLERHDKLMSKLSYEIRCDLNVLPRDDATCFKIGLWASGVGTQSKHT